MNRQPRGIPTGGEFAASARSEANIDLNDIPARDALDTALADLGIDAVPDVDGVPFTRAWSEKFAVLAGPRPPSEGDEIIAQLGGKGNPRVVLARPGNYGAETRALEFYPDPTAMMHGWRLAAFRDSGPQDKIIGVDDIESDDPRQVVALDETEALREALSRRSELEDYLQAEKEADDVAKGNRPPWFFCPVNPDIADVRDAEEQLSRVPVEDIDAQVSRHLSIRYPGGVNSSTLNTLNATVAYMRGESDEKPSSNEVYISGPIRTAEQAREIIAVGKESQAALDALSSGKVDPAVVAALAHTSAVSQWESNVRLAGQWRESRARALAEMEVATAEIDRYVTDRKERSSHSNRMYELRWALRWPGNLGDCPARKRRASIDW